MVQARSAVSVVPASLFYSLNVLRSLILPPLDLDKCAILMRMYFQPLFKEKRLALEYFIYKVCGNLYVSYLLKKNQRMHA